LHALAERAMRDRPVADPLPKIEEFLRSSHQAVPEPLACVARGIDEGLDVALQMRPAPLQSVTTG
jgi:hypothetical protein